MLMYLIRIILITLLALSYSLLGNAGDKLLYEQLLGSKLFKDRNLSLNKTQSCSSCHSLAELPGVGTPLDRVTGFVDPDNVKNGTPVSAGAILGQNGSLNAPSVSYATHSPFFHWDETEGLYIGGQFWNGRANTLADQAKQPFLKSTEMAMPNKWAVVSRVRENHQYRKLFRQAYGINLAAIPDYPKQKNNRLKIPASVDKVYSRLAKAIGEFEKTQVFNKFNSKFDYVLAGLTLFTALERKGFELFNDESKGNCAACHISEPEHGEYGQLIPPLFTDFTYDNIGLPRNVLIPNNPEPNPGLGGRPDIAKIDLAGNEMGKHKVMSLRNIAVTPPYGHNGVFSTLEQIVHFYNTRDTLGEVPDNRDPGFGKSGWPKPEIVQNVNRSELGDLKLTQDEELAIVAFMKTLTDDYPAWGNDPLIPPGAPSPYTK
jgi:cytochrome c peroxidase